jgi:hypothetical protein
MEAATRAAEDRIAELMGIINTATSQLVEVIAGVLASDAWQGWGIRSPEHWVTWRCGVSPARARRLVAMARARTDLPEVSGVFAAGELSEDQAAIVFRHTPPGRDREIAGLAPLLTVPQLRHVVASLPPDDPPTADPDADSADQAAPPEPEPERREVTFGWRDDGRWWLRALLPAEEGALVQAALEAARQAEFTTRHPDPIDDGYAHVAAMDRITWSDALLHLARGEQPTPPEVLVHVDAAHPERARLHLGPLLDRSTTSGLSCDAAVRVVIERGGRPVALGRRRRTVPRWLRRLIETRDGGCRVPGCAQRRWLHIHHLHHWEVGGRTDPDNLCALCPFHHRMLHRGHVFIAGDPETPDGLTFTDNQGRQLTPARVKPPPHLPTANRYTNPLGERLQRGAIIWQDRQDNNKAS